MLIDFHFLQRINVPSLHIVGSDDPYFEQSTQLYELYSKDISTKIIHNEMHNIPSPRTQVYDQINTWIASTVVE